MSDSRPNGLMTSASAKVDLMQRMRAVCRAVGAEMHAADSDPFAAALHFADGAVLLPRLDDLGFMDALLAYCDAHAIGFILPTRDGDLAYFADRADDLRQRGIVPIVSPAETIRLCQDKICFYEHCVANGLPVLPRIEKPTEVDFPCFVRRRHDAASAGCFRADNRVMLEGCLGSIPLSDVLIQPFLETAEYTVDVLFDWQGVPVQWIARQRIRVKGGESVVGQTVLLPGLDDLICKLAQDMRFTGPVTLQLFHEPPDVFWLIEVNARLGGGAALGIEAGLDTPARLLQLVRGDAEGFAAPRALRYGLTMLRYSSDVFLDQDHV